MTGNKILGILIAFLVAVSFAPITGQAAFADELQNSFNASGKVTGLYQAAAEYNNVTIRWSAYNGAQGYTIYRASKKKGKYKKIATIAGCSFKDKGNKKLGKKKYYKVRAYRTVNSVRQYTQYSVILAAKPRVGTPTGFYSSSGNGSVTLGWNKVPGATKYQVYRATSKTGKYTRLGTTKKKYYTNTSLTKGQKYYYKVRAYKKKHGKKYGSFTAPIEGMTRPGVVGGFCVSLSEIGTVTGNWNRASGASGYELQRAVSEDSAYVTVGETAALSLQDMLTESGTYRYRVRAFAIVNGKRVYGDFSSGGRSSAISQAQSWVGCKESNGSHKKIIDVYNNYNPRSGKISYGTSWCAAFVSAVAIKTGNTGVIPVDCYCPRMINNFAHRTNNKSYTPQGGDVVFYDWNNNKIPDHVGMIESVSGNNVTAIEGNYSDAVKRRTFKKGYSLLLSYGLPDYAVKSEVSYTAPEGPAPEDGDDLVEAASVSEEDILQACEEITAPEESLGSVEETAGEPAESAEPEAEAFAKDAEPASEEATVAAAAVEEETAVEEPVAAESAEPMTEVETAEKIIEYIQEEAPAENESAEESAYNAVLVYGVCDEMDIDACVVTITDGNGDARSYNEVVLDGELYVLDATEGGGVLEKYTPEEIN